MKISIESCFRPFFLIPVRNQKYNRYGEPPLFATNVDELTVLQPSVDWTMMGGDNRVAGEVGFGLNFHILKMSNLDSQLCLRSTGMVPGRYPAQKT